MASENSITKVIARGLYDSNGRAAVEVTLVDGAGRSSSALAPRGSSVGEYEPAHLEDAASQPRLRAVAPAVRAVAQQVEPALVGLDASDLTAVDRRLDDLDPPPSRKVIGGNTTIATSMAVAQLGALQRSLPLHTHLRDFVGLPEADRPPLPAMNIIDGGLCPSSKVPHIEFLLFPDPDVQLLDAVETSIRVRDYAREVCYRRGYEAATSQQGAISVPLQSCTEGMDIILAVLQELGVESGFRLGLDMAASDVWRNGKYQFPWTNRALSADALLDTYLEWIPRYSLRYLEDGFSASAMSEFTVLTSKAGDMMIAGDDLFASNVSRVTAGVQGGWANAVVVKPNQAGTVSAAIRAAEATRNNGATLVISQRSGENGGSFISSLAIACGARYIKVGGPARMDRIAKINELLTTLAPK